MLVELLIHLLSVFGGYSVDLHQSGGLTIGDLFRIQIAGLAFPQIARWAVD